MKRSLKTEDIIYAALWTFIFIVPLIMLYTDSVREGEAMQWEALFPFWKQTKE
jgi:MFS-type transporter involved in bile tolerance (Atg22 family)